MPIIPLRYAYAPSYVDAVAVTRDNIREVAAWCDGTIVEGDDNTGIRTHIKVNVTKPKSPHQSMAFIGNLVLKTHAGWKVYNAKAFERDFVPVTATARVENIFEVPTNLEENK